MQLKVINNILLLSFSFLFTTSELLAQKGFLGWQHELSVDGFRALYEGDFRLEYQFTPKERLSFVLIGGIQKTNLGEMELSTSLELQFLPPSGNSAINVYNGKAIGLGIYYTGLGGLSMPIGWYAAYKYIYHKGTITNIEDPSDEKYGVTKHLLAFGFGKNILIGNRFTLDFEVNYGYSVNIMEATDINDLVAPPIYPRDIFIFNKTGTNLSIDNDRWTALQFYLWPSVKFGVMF